VTVFDIQDVPVLNEVPRHEEVWGMEVKLHAFLTSALDGGKWSASRPCRFTPGKSAPFTIG